LPGGTLQQQVPQGGARPDVARVREWVGQTAAALDAAAQRGLVHRDVKPGNIFLDAEGRAKLADFGIARMRTRSGGPVSRVIGTTDFMAPEQFRVGADLTPAADVFALGVTLWFLLVGELPLPEGGLSLLSPGSRAPRLASRWPECPPDLDDLVARMLEAAPAARPSAGEVRVRLAAGARPEPKTEVLVPAAGPAAGAQPFTPAAPPGGAEVFISFSSRDRPAALRIVDLLEAAGVSVWLDQTRIVGGANYGSEIVRGVKNCRVLLLICSNASLRSRNVKQEIQLAWKYERPYLPLLLERTGFPEQVEYWLEGWQWVEVLDRPPAEWLPEVLRALAAAGVHVGAGSVPTAEVVAPRFRDLGGAQEAAPPPLHGLEGLHTLARHTDQLWPLLAGTRPRGAVRSLFRDLGAPQEEVRHRYRLGDRVCLALEVDRPGHLLLLDEGPSGTVYCLCPSAFAPDTRVVPGRLYLPAPGSRYDAFVVSGRPGREHLLALLTDEPLDLDWMPPDPSVPARVLSQADLAALPARLRVLEGDRWTALSTYFDVLP
ncbi:MAG: TIR domain-containing protein, partial [Armatimonadetes bacterium]|nr:TIR domain-containing protein [Armatimonadota bacterium]